MSKLYSFILILITFSSCNVYQVLGQKTKVGKNFLNKKKPVNKEIINQIKNNLNIIQKVLLNNNSINGDKYVISKMSDKIDLVIVNNTNMFRKIVPQIDFLGIEDNFNIIYENCSGIELGYLEECIITLEPTLVQSNNIYSILKIKYFNNSQSIFNNKEIHLLNNYDEQ